MTVASEVSRSGPYTGNGVTTIFNYEFRILDEDHLRVILAEDGIETVLEIDSDYIVSDVGEPGGGQIALVSAPTASQTLTILRNVPFTQETDLENQGVFNAETIEAALDQAAMRDQQLSERLDRAITVPASADPGALNDLIADVLLLADRAEAIDTVAGVAADVSVVAAIDADVSTVAGIAADVSVVAANDANVSTVAGVAADVSVVAANVADVTNFSDVYQGPSAAPPVLRNNGSALQIGDLYFDTVLLALRAFKGGSDWTSPTVSSSDFANILDYGAVGDGDIANAALNAAALTAALATKKTVLIPYTADGYHFGTNTIVLGSGMNIVGENSVKLKSTTTTAFFSVTTYFHESGVSGVTIDGSGCGAASSMFRFRTDLGVVYRVRFDRITFENCYEVFGDVSSVSNYIVDARFTNIRILNAQGRSIKFLRSRGFFFWENIQHDHGLNTGPITWIDGYFDDAIGLEIKRWDCSAGNIVTPSYQPGAWGLYIENSVSIWLERVEVDSTSGNGIGLKNVRFPRMNFCSAFGNLGNQINLDGCYEATISNSNVTGAHGFDGDGGGAGFTLQGCYKSSVTNIDITNCSASALVVNDCSKLAISDVVVYDNTGYAYALLGTSDRVTLDNGVFDNNTAGTVLDTASGTKNRITNIVGYNPVGAANPAATVGASPWTYTAGRSPETLYLSATTSITQVTQGGVSILPQATPANGNLSVSLGPNESVVITYTGTLAAKKMVH